MKSVIVGFFLVIVIACTPRQEGVVKPVDKTEPNKQLNEQLSSKDQTLETKTKIAPPIFNKTLREAIYFSSSLEREALKLIFNNNSLQKLSLFSVLSYIVEINTGAKKSTPYGLDCGKFEVSRDQKIIKIFKTCVKPIVEVVEINIISEDSLYDVEFMIKEWANVVGLPVVLTGNNVRCQLKVTSHKLNSLNCNNWSYLTHESQISSTVIKTNHFVFERNAQKQFVIKGGFFKELIENKKLDIVVPLEGKIKIIEKELKVIDDFAKIVQQDLEGGKKNEQKEELKKEAKQEIGQETNQEIKQEVGQEANQEINQEIPAEEINQEAQPQENHQEGNEVSQDTSPAVNPQDGRSRGRGR
ncbi:MAG: hypothetical protein AABY53_00795 [Bdellovibrionota bacterium]